MEVWEWTLTIALPLAALLWGAALRHQRGTWFLAGWNTLPPEEKGAWQAKALCRLIRNLCHGLRPWPVSPAVRQLPGGRISPCFLGLGIFGGHGGPLPGPPPSLPENGTAPGNDPRPSPNHTRRHPMEHHPPTLAISGLRAGFPGPQGLVPRRGRGGPHRPPGHHRGPGGGVRLRQERPPPCRCWGFSPPTAKWPGGPSTSAGRTC